MGLFSKLFGKLDDSVDMYGDEQHYFDDVKQKVETYADQFGGSNAGSTVQRSCSWGSTMPAEENQYSFSGSYVDYFKKVFAEEFPAYGVSCEAVPERRIPATMFTFTAEGRKLLVVELMSERSSIRSLAEQCRSDGVAYLRFYYDHYGWWNTRSYVAGRVRGALGR